MHLEGNTRFVYRPDGREVPRARDVPDQILVDFDDRDARGPAVLLHDGRGAPPRRRAVVDDEEVDFF